MADESEEMINKYLNNGRLFVFEKDGLIGLCIITNEGESIFEIKNMVVLPQFRRKGYGSKIIELISEYYQVLGASSLIVGTGESPLTLPFYFSCGFEVFDKKKDFFTNNYPHPIIEAGVLLKDMVLLKKNL